MSEQKKLYRSRDDKMVCGVCEGLGKYFEVDPVLFRLGFVALTLVGGGGLLAYLIMCVVVPEEPQLGA